jgi:hypothetical protein
MEVLQIAFLVDLCKATNISKIRGHQTFAEVTGDMSWKEAQKRCKGITFDPSGNITKIELANKGLTGKTHTAAHYININSKR